MRPLRKRWPLLFWGVHAWCIHFWGIGSVQIEKQLKASKSRKLIEELARSGTLPEVWGFIPELVRAADPDSSHMRKLKQRHIIPPQRFFGFEFRVCNNIGCFGVSI